MRFRLVAVAALIILVSASAGTAIAFSSGGLSTTAMPASHETVPDQVEHFLSPSDVGKNVDGTAVRDVDTTESGLTVTGPASDDPFDAIVAAEEDAYADIVLDLDQLNDTSGDGYPDAVLEAVPPLAKHDPDPERRNVFVEVDYMEGCDPTTAIEQTTAAFANAPIENPDGSTGIDLHVSIGDELPRSAIVTPRETGLASPPAAEYYDQSFDRDGLGYHYVVFAHNTGPAAGFQHSGDADATVLECGSGDTFMHELGHALGISHDIPVVDSYTVDFDDYPSTMNYDRPDDYFGFSNGTASDVAHDDWETIESSMATQRPSLHGLHGSALRVEDPVSLVQRYEGVETFPEVTYNAENSR